MMVRDGVERKTKIRGVSRLEPNSGKPRQEIIKKHIRPGTRLDARLEPDNPVNPDAVALWFGSFHLGYLSDDLSDEISEQLRMGTPVAAAVLQVTGGTKEKETLGVNIVLRYDVTGNISSDRLSPDVSLRDDVRRRNVLLASVFGFFLCLCLCVVVGLLAI